MVAFLLFLWLPRPPGWRRKPSYHWASISHLFPSTLPHLSLISWKKRAGERKQQIKSLGEDDTTGPPDCFPGCLGRFSECQLSESHAPEAFKNICRGNNRLFLPFQQFLGQVRARSLIICSMKPRHPERWEDLGYKDGSSLKPSSPYVPGASPGLNF